MSRVSAVVTFVSRILIICSVGLTAMLSAEPSDDAPAHLRVIILANASDPDSLRVASYYADKRAIPAENIVALPMATGDSISWRVFVDTVYQPLQDELVRRHWIYAIRTELRDAIGRVKYLASGHKISYLVVCRGVPLRVEHDAGIYTQYPPLTDSPQFQTNSGAVDSELSLIAVPNYPISAFLGNPLYGKDRPTMFDLAQVVKVSRLDGPTLSDAIALVDSALAGEMNGLIGRAYVDVGGKYKVGDEWFEATAREIEGADFDLTVDRNPTTFPATARFDAPVLYFGWYASDICGPFLQPEFHFPPGAVALHLHSFSARTLSSSHYGWTGPLIARGVAATVGNVDEPYLNLTHRPDLMVRALLRGDRWGDAVYYSLPALSWRTMAIGDPLYRPLARSFAQQWVHRDELSPVDRSYVVLRELRRLERDSQVGKALLLARAEMQSHPSAPVALKWSELAEGDGKVDDAVRGAAWIASLATVKPAELPLAEEAAQILVHHGQATRAVEFYGRLLAVATLSREFRRELLDQGIKAAAAAHRDDLVTRWSAEMSKLGQG